MTEVHWLPEALDDIQRLHDFLLTKDSQAAGRAARCILNGAELLEQSARLGRPMDDETGRRELFLAFGAGAYVLRYRLTTDGAVVVIRVWHSRESRD